MATQAKFSRSGKKGAFKAPTSENEEVLMLSATVSKRLEALPDSSKQGRGSTASFGS